MNDEKQSAFFAPMTITVHRPKSGLVGFIFLSLYAINISVSSLFLYPAFLFRRLGTVADTTTLYEPTKESFMGFVSGTGAGIEYTTDGSRDYPFVN